MTNARNPPWRYTMPNPFTIVILFMYLGSCLFHAYHGRFGSSMYWVCAFGITASVEILIPRFQ